ncbi:prepilin-type N-terminal cleavage/methylation domain-containing protein [Sporolactobacillus terrae]|uniref:Prepilin-type N-terminal cleavage/methylation domain-containing protein n=1 Tax=Sporolactobacillus terrae TaxID=269673 RepID=A0ABX5Q8D7_9BACL|nr:prepilin-type N-terminal cleavage/methylation domain-containing protein [Sporolactobacillus terrae]QAA22891.1 hypothetical protein C0674_09795 [Sporolactobacillus terrae]QAA25864.1 hypothetical protein C0679_09775 [Sporolactobacillus terrae]UAK17738.1 prepilin-type N-terminal cleavage/methylation domain-containing protein [Sporolactobacillus terrae]
MLKKILQKANEKKNQKGFTLIELLAVIVILAILAAIAIPSVISIINKQNDKAKVQDAITVIHAAKLYVADNRTTEDTTLDQDDLAKYLDDQNISLSSYSVSVDVGDDHKATYSITASDLPNQTGNSDVSESALLNYNRGGSSTNENNE